MMLGAVVSSTLAGQALSRWNRYRYLALLGMGVMTTGVILLATMDSATSSGVMARNMVIVGAGLGITFPLFTIVVQNAFPYGLMGLVTAFVQFFRSIGGSLGVAVMGSLLASRLSTHLAANLSPETRELMGTALTEDLRDPNALVSPEARAMLEERLEGMGESAVLESVVEAMRESLASSDPGGVHRGGGVCGARGGDSGWAEGDTVEEAPPFRQGSGCGIGGWVVGDPCYDGLAALEESERSSC